MGLKGHTEIMSTYGMVFTWGPSVPSDGDSGFAPGCVFVHIDGSGDGSLYKNEGTFTSANFDALVSGAFDLGSQANTAGSGIALSSSVTGIIRAFADDNDTNINSSVRNIQARTLLDATQTGGTIRSLQGQMKLVDGVGLGTGVYTAVQGYWELMGDHTFASAAYVSCFDASLEIASGKALSISSGGVFAAFKAETTGTGSFINSGTCAAFMVLNASGSPAWPLGLFITGTDVVEGIRVGSFHSTVAGSGVTLATAVSAANRFYSDDGGAAIVNTGVNDTRGVLSRVLLTTDHTANELRLFGISGHVKAYDAEWDNEMVGGVYGYLEIQKAGDSNLTLDGYGISAGVMACVETNEAGSNDLIIGTNHIVAGVAAVSKLDRVGDLTQTGKTTGLLVAAYDSTNWSDSIAVVDWGYGIIISSAVTAGILISDTPTDGILITGACGDGIHISGTCTSTAIHISGDQVICVDIDVDENATSGIHMSTASSKTTGTGILLDGAGTFTVGITLSASTVGTGIAIGAATTGISFTGAQTTGIDFTGATLTPDGSRTNSAIAIGDRAGAHTITMSGATLHLDPIQMNLVIAGTAPSADTTINGIYQLITSSDDTDMAGLRLKCSDWNIVVKKDIKDVYCMQGEVDFTTNSLEVHSEAACLGLVMNCASTVTGDVRGIIISMQGTGTPAGAVGIELRSTTTTALAEGIRIMGTPLITVGIAMGSQDGDNQGPTHAFFFPSPPGADIGPCVGSAEAGTGAGSIKIKIGSSTKYLQYWDNAA